MKALTTYITNNHWYNESIKIAVPLLFSLLLQNLITITDTIFLGRIGEIELGASALAGVFYMAVFFIGFGFGVGVQVLISRLNGEEKYGDIGAVVWQSVLFLFLLAAVVITLSVSVIPAAFKYMITSDLVREASIEYLIIRIFGLLPAYIGIIYRSFFVGIKNTSVLIYSAMAMTATNILLNYLLIFGAMGIPAMGIRGAAWASVIAECVGVLYYLLYRRIKPMVLYKFIFFKRPDWAVIGRILRVSSWTMLQYFISVFSWFLFFLAIEHVGERELAISNIVRSISTLLFVAISAFGTTTASLTGNVMGESRVNEVPKIGRTNMYLCALLLFPFILAMSLFPEGTLAIFTNKQELITSSIPAYYVMLSYFFIAIPSSMLFNIVLGSGNTKGAFIIELLSLIVYMAVIVGIWIWKPAVWICWFSEHIYWAVTLIAAMIYLRHSNWKERVI